MSLSKLVDTDVLIWYLRGDKNAYELIHNLGEFAISSVTYMELIQGMRNKNELRTFKRAIKQWGVKVIYIDTEISAKALFYVEEYFLSHSMQLADALISATATTSGMSLYTANVKYYKVVKELDISIFIPFKNK